jgi:hypothetical protein
MSKRCSQSQSEFIADHNMHQLFMADLRINLFLSVLCPKKVHIDDEATESFP